MRLISVHSILHIPVYSRHPRVCDVNNINERSRAMSSSLHVIFDADTSITASAFCQLCVAVLSIHRQHCRQRYSCLYTAALLMLTQLQESSHVTLPAVCYRSKILSRARISCPECWCCCVPRSDNLRPAAEESIPYN